MNLHCTQCGYMSAYREGLRYCAGCGSAMSLGSAVASQLPANAAPDLDDFLELAEEAFRRAESAEATPMPVVKKHLSQADLDRLFS